MALRIFFFILFPLNTEIGAASGRSMEPSYQGDEDKADAPRWCMWSSWWRYAVSSFVSLEWPTRTT
ncbi:hypothetical protein MAR_024704 [Mya arenaria]|uniref:Uncharacterized protein n=1 Tax=Mya arenaria TaxID=6604 RepID=A0ABY7DU08_MYAAR|nr:hypothetical protein MAR_024704 [Mya arenaria]